MRRLMRVCDYYKLYQTKGGIFSLMQNVPWPKEVSDEIDELYFDVYSGLKYPTYIMRRYACVLDSDRTLTRPQRQRIAELVYAQYSRPWDALWEAYVTKYLPLEDIRDFDTIARDETIGSTTGVKGSLDHTIDNTDKKTTDGTKDRVITYGKITDGTDDTQHYIYGFNAPTESSGEYDWKQSEQTHEKLSGTDKINDKYHETVDETAKEVKKEGTTEDTKFDERQDENIRRERNGHNGRYSYQELLDQQFSLWKWNFFASIFEDVDKILCLPAMG